MTSPVRIARSNAPSWAGGVVSCALSAVAQQRISTTGVIDRTRITRTPYACGSSCSTSGLSPQQANDSADKLQANSLPAPRCVYARRSCGAHNQTPPEAPASFRRLLCRSPVRQGCTRQQHPAFCTTTIAPASTGCVRIETGETESHDAPSTPNAEPKQTDRSSITVTF